MITRTFVTPTLTRYYAQQICCLAPQGLKMLIIIHWHPPPQSRVFRHLKLSLVIQIHKHWIWPKQQNPSAICSLQERDKSVPATNLPAADIWCSRPPQRACQASKKSSKPSWDEALLRPIFIWVYYHCRDQTFYTYIFYPYSYPTQHRLKKKVQTFSGKAQV